jgi:hypothetical protein
MDTRIKQLEKDIENELNTSKSKYAFTGFGRSTDTAEASGKVSKEGTKLMSGLTWVIQAEERLKTVMEFIARYPEAEGNSEALSSAQEDLAIAKNEFGKLKNEQSKRLKKLSEEILSASRNVDIKHRYNNAFRKFKSRPEGRNFLKVKAVSPTRTKVYKPGMERKENIVPQRKLSNILSSERKLGRTLSGIKK